MSKTRREVNQFFHEPVDVGSGLTADYVVAHGERQIQRGKNPSIAPYADEKNPRKAFETAKSDLRYRELWDSDSADYAGRVLIVHIEDETLTETARIALQSYMRSDWVTGGNIRVISDNAPTAIGPQNNGTIDILIASQGEDLVTMSASQIPAHG